MDFRLKLTCFKFWLNYCLLKFRDDLEGFGRVFDNLRPRETEVPFGRQMQVVYGMTVVPGNAVSFPIG